jgi:2-amino-4-hydroxy-6-hydroxymethyldihydropteridine diphosphokinase
LPGAELDCLSQLRKALHALDQLAFSKLRRVSSCYQSKAWSDDAFDQQPDYLNAVCELATELSADALLRECQAIEIAQGRERDPQRRFGPRTLDLDLLLFGQSQIRSLDLRVPHPRLHERAFVLVPLLEIAPDMLVPGLGKAKSLLANLDQSEIHLKDYPLWVTSTRT